MTNYSKNYSDKDAPPRVMAPIADAIDRLLSSGVDITDGIVVKAKDEHGYPTEVDVYGDVPPYAFGYYNADGAMGRHLTNVTFKTALSKIGSGAFQKTEITDMEIPDSVDSIGIQAFRANTVLGSYIHENARDLYNYNGAAMRALEQCNDAISKIQLGAVGKPVTGLYNFLTTREYNALTLTIYCTGNEVDSFLNRARQFITGGTIVFKASEATTYNGTSYAAGDTILTSEVIP